jgi:catechol-2,3-dioxygenase
MVDWYVNVLACRIQGTGDGITFLTYDQEHHRIAIKDLGAGDELNASRLRRTAGVAHFAFAWDDIGGLLEVYKRARAFGVLPIRSIRHGVTISFYYDDPDKNNLEFQVDLMDVESSNRYMLTDAFKKNPHGELLDPEELVARFDAGEAVDDLVYRSDQPQRLGSSITKDTPVVFVRFAAHDR